MKDATGAVRATIKIDPITLEDIKADAKSNMRPWTVHIVALAKEALKRRAKEKA